MPIMPRPNSEARKLHKQILLHTQKFGADSESFDVEEISIEEAPNLMNKKTKAPKAEIFVGTEAGS